MVAMATQYSLPGYKAGPFEQSEVIKFLTEFGQVKKDADENGKLERVKFEFVLVYSEVTAVDFTAKVVTGRT